MKNYLFIAAFTVTVSIVYTGVAQLLPQLENHPPVRIELGANIGPEDLSAAGEGVFQANCVQCHRLGEAGRAPDLSGIGGRASDRAAERAKATGKEYGAVDYLVESLCQPGEYLVQGFGNIMPPQGRILSGGQLLAVVAFLQDLGATATVRGTDAAPVERFGCIAGGLAASPASPGAPGGQSEAAAAPVGKPEEVFTAFGCATCHALDKPDRLIGPSLQDVGKRLDKGQIYEAILAPEASVPVAEPPFPPGLMKQTLDGNGFYKRMTPGDYQALVDWLAGKKG